MKAKKTRIAIISVVALLLVLIGVTYAYWLVTKTQTNQNIILSACLDITLDNEANAISLSSQYPLSKEDGMSLTPYTFKVTNNCNTSIDYQVVLESIGDEANAIKASALQVALDTKADLLSNRASVSSTVNGAYAAHRLGYGTLSATGNEGSGVTHSLRIWIDESAPISEANKAFQSKITVTIGQGVSNPIKEGTMAYDILSNNEEPTVLSATLVSGTPTAETYSSVGKTSNYWYGTSYTLDEVGNYQLSGDLVQATLTECREGTKSCGEYTLQRSSQDSKSTILYKITSFTNATMTDTTSTLYMTTQIITAKNDFSTSTVDGEGGLYKTTDDLGESYYFRGDVSNNYVQFGLYVAGSTANGVTYEKETLLYWRIVRINGDGTIRLVFDGTAKKQNGVAHTATIGSTTFNNDNSEEKYIGYTYDASETDMSQVNSTIKTLLDNWYNTHLRTNYGSFIADGIFCNDREVTSGYYVDEYWNPTTKENAAYIGEYYGSSSRLSSGAPDPKLTCTNKSDRYTTKTSLGNGLLTHPVGLLTADEIVLAGYTLDILNNTYYLYSGETFWSISPIYHDEGAGAYASIFMHYNEEMSMGATVTSAAKVRPVINLRADIEFTGNGSYETPYIIKTN